MALGFLPEAASQVTSRLLLGGPTVCVLTARTGPWGTVASLIHHDADCAGWFAPPADQKFYVVER
jgi:hypothetical protein